jgi:hypothetical protein
MTGAPPFLLWQWRPPSCDADYCGPDLQTSLIRDNLEHTLDNSWWMVDLTRQLANEARRIVTVRAEESLQRVSRAA